ncbi:MAG: hypothetical protein N2689_04925 [Verrucomicrobiae bacterium]|nr:hypothetical protein [Verrucomicrobiae bacterium]
MIIKTPQQARRLSILVISVSLVAAGVGILFFPKERHWILAIAGGISLVVAGAFLMFRPREATRVFAVVGGMVLLIAGGIMMLTPGPGIPALIGGLALLATEFVWARRMLERVKAEALKVKNAVVGSLNDKKSNDEKK